MNKRIKKKLRRRFKLRSYKKYKLYMEWQRNIISLDRFPVVDYIHPLQSRSQRLSNKQLEQIVNEMRELTTTKQSCMIKDDLPVITIRHDIVTDNPGACDIHETIDLPIRFHFQEPKGTYTGVPINVTVLKSRNKPPQQGVMSFIRFENRAQSLIDGICTRCRREKFCSKPCKRHIE